MTGATKPVRIQRRRTKDWRMPPNTVYVGRPSRWSNPYEEPDAVGMYRRAMLAEHETIKQQLRGKNLACWCPLDQSCHADFLLEIANA